MSKEERRKLQAQKEKISQLSKALNEQTVPPVSVSSAQPASTSPHPSSAPATVPWYESTFLWGALGLAAAILSSVIVPVLENHLELVYVSWPFFVMAGWSFSKHTVSGRYRAWLSTIALSATFLVGLYAVQRALAAKVAEKTAREHYDVLSDIKRRQEFVKKFKGDPTQSHYRLEFSCSTFNESSCIKASGFLSLFSEAGWIIDPQEIQRYAIGRPQSGVSVVHPTDSRPGELPPHLGRWTKLSDGELAIGNALNDLIGKWPVFTGDHDLPTDKLRVHFEPD